MTSMVNNSLVPSFAAHSPLANFFNFLLLQLVSCRPRSSNFLENWATHYHTRTRPIFDVFQDSALWEDVLLWRDQNWLGESRRRKQRLTSWVNFLIRRTRIQSTPINCEILWRRELSVKQVSQFLTLLQTQQTNHPITESWKLCSLILSLSHSLSLRNLVWSWSKDSLTSEEGWILPSSSQTWLLSSDHLLYLSIQQR